MTRRGFFTALGGAGLFAAGSRLLPHLEDASAEGMVLSAHDGILPFYGVHQSGIITQQQQNSYFAAFDLVTTKREDIVAMLKRWTEATARMTKGQTAAEIDKDTTKPAGDSGEVLHLRSANLTLTFGFGAGLFTKDGKDRYGLASKRPAALVDMPKFNGDQLIAEKSGGDISVQACAEDPQVAFHAVRQLARLAADVAQIRWAQAGFLSGAGGGETPRNLMGFKDGTQQPKPAEHDKFVWVGAEGPDWMQGGSYVVARRIRIALEHWDNTQVDFQEEVVGRRKYSGAPLTGKVETDALDLAAADKDGNSVIPDNAHVRLANAATNGGAQILRRGYSYNDGVNFTAERWPPWKQGMEYDAGLFFLCYQQDPREGFIKIFDKMAKLDALNQFATHTSNGVFACPPGVHEGEFIGQKLFA